MTHCTHNNNNTPRDLFELLYHTKTTLASDFLNYASSSLDISDANSLLSYVNDQLSTITNLSYNTSTNTNAIDQILSLISLSSDWSLYICKLVSKALDPHHKHHHHKSHGYCDIPFNISNISNKNLLPITIVSASIAYILYDVYRYLRRKEHTLSSNYDLLYLHLLRNLRESEAMFAQLNHLTRETHLSDKELQITLLNLLCQASKKIYSMLVWLQGNYDKLNNKYPAFVEVVTVCSGFVLSYTPSKNSPHH